jgi:hypothetical protein
VRVVCEKPAKGWGEVERYDEGVIQSISDGDCKIDFPNQSGWAGLLSELEVIGTLTDQTMEAFCLRD